MDNVSDNVIKPHVAVCLYSLEIESCLEKTHP